MDIFSDRISSKIEDRLVALQCATDIVRFSFIAQNSISPLDLPQQDGLRTFNREVLFGFSTSSVLDSTIQYPKYVINTEEKCRKILSTTRDFLYRLHLDLPKKRECSLRDGPETENLSADSSRRHIGKKTVHPNIHFTVLSRLVKEAVIRSDKKLKMVK
ncbi:hypothetical protein AVEN_41803-1 [Araneus ventricosus]|uniref:Uncharacterized protein n=1 Tax=Araneus ventricosus TaxID=182803 RepID=A0A4Y2ABX4_ARAVE|nr:hypothetical protein AVEN_41803-1 [Araneus ventricosus]